MVKRDNDPKYCATYEIEKIIKALSGGDYMEALAILDPLRELKKSHNLYFASATIRNLVMDLNGSLEDLNRLPINVEDYNLLRANVLSKMGKIYESIYIIKELGSNKGIGIAGRRIDLYLMGIKDGTLPDHILTGWEVGCVAGHLLALAEWELLEKMFESMDKTDSKEYVEIFRELKECGALFDRDSDLGVAAEIEKIMGWFSEDEAEYIARLAKKVPAESNIVEIGSFCGRSTISLILGSRNGMQAKVHSVDPHLGLTSIHPDSTFPPFVMNLKEKNLLQYVAIHRCNSADLADSWEGGKIGLLFIDADHSYDSVNSDFNLWHKYLLEGALVIFHDYPQVGPNRLIREILTNYPEFFPHSFMDSLFVFEYRPRTVKVDLTRNVAFMKFLELMGRSYDYWIKSEEESSVKKSIDILEKYAKGVGWA